MADERTLLAYGALLHDVGELSWRSHAGSDAPAALAGEFFDGVGGRNPAFAGEAAEVIIDQTRYRTRDDLLGAGLPASSLAFVTWFADTVALGQKSPAGDMPLDPASRDLELRKIFNTLNGHADDNTVAHGPYGDILTRLGDGLAEIGVSTREVAALISLVDGCLSDVPATTSPDSLTDVSLFDRAKTRAGIAACVYDYLTERGATDFHSALLEDAGAASAEEMFVLCSCDMSGIQDFIYSISGDGALKQLRARSMYLELVLEHVVDEVLARLGLGRQNLLYTGGGHAYLLLPNTERAKSALEGVERELGQWLVENYRNDLFVAWATVACSADDLANRGPDKGRYPELYRRLSRGLSEAKASRYDVATIRALNFSDDVDFDHARECSECHRSDLDLDEDGKCPLCSSLGAISANLVRRDVFVVRRTDRVGRRDLRLPFGCTLRMCTRDEYHEIRDGALRAYVKGDWEVSDGPATRILMGDYTAPVSDAGISDYAQTGITLRADRGIKRLGVLRADVDDLGAAFVGGLPDERLNICRTIALSRSLSAFFKSQINGVLEHGAYQAQIIYSGGDDLFIVGNWSDVIHAACDIRQAFLAYTGNASLTISAGIGIFGATYPIARMAEETGRLEDAAKSRRDETGRITKDAVALWDERAVFSWDEFQGQVLPRANELDGILAGNDKGNSFIYKVIDLLRNWRTTSTPRLAYLLARSFEDVKDRQSATEASAKLYAWARDEDERKRLVTALEYYVMSMREGA